MEREEEERIMTMKHRDTGELVFVIGFFMKPTKGTYARCLCDARLHPERWGQRYEGSIEMEIAAHNLVPVELPKWNEIERLYPKGRFEQILKKKHEEHVRNVNNNAQSVYVKERAELLKDGILEDEAERLATAKKESYIESHLNQPKSGVREAKW